MSDIKTFLAGNLKRLRDDRDLTQEKIAIDLEMNRLTYSNYEKERAEPSLESLNKIAAYYQIDIDTLVNKNLNDEKNWERYKHRQHIYNMGKEARIIVTSIDAQERENVQLIPEKARAGYAAGYADPDYIKELPVFRLPSQILPEGKQYRTFQISGDSMLPIPDKSYVTGAYVESFYDIKDGDACIVVTEDEGVVFKIVRNLLNEEGKIELHSLNPLYKPYKVEMSKVREMWKFSNYLSSQIPDPPLKAEDIISKIDQLRDELSRRLIK